MSSLITIWTGLSVCFRNIDVGLSCAMNDISTGDIMRKGDDLMVCGATQLSNNINL